MTSRMFVIHTTCLSGYNLGYIVCHACTDPGTDPGACDCGAPFGALGFLSFLRLFWPGLGFGACPGPFASPPWPGCLGGFSFFGVVFTGRSPPSAAPPPLPRPLPRPLPPLPPRPPRSPPIGKPFTLAFSTATLASSSAHHRWNCISSANACSAFFSCSWISTRLRGTVLNSSFRS